MKTRNMLLVTLLGVSSAYGQQASQQTLNPQNPKQLLNPTEVPITYLGETVKLIDFVEAPGTINEQSKRQNLGYSPKKDWPLNESVNPHALPGGDDPVWQQKYPDPAPPTKALTVNYDAMGYSNVHPADPSVDVGPNHVVQMINGGSGAYIQVYDKSGNTIGNQVYFDNFMSMAGGAGDPIVMYDERADRWFLSEFSSSGNNLHIAISTTADPTGSYHTYVFNSPGGFPDYPKYSIWENEYVMTANVGSPDIFALNRADMLAGNATTAQMFSMSNFGTIGFQAAGPVSMNGTTLPPNGQAALLMRMRDDAWAGAASDALEMWELDIDWANSANSALTQVQTLAISPHESELCGYTSFSCFPQPSGNNDLDPLRELLMNRLHYRNFGTHESIVCCHVTDVNGNDRGGIRWYELRRTGGISGSWSIYQEGTYAPNTDSHNRWMPSIAISATGNIGLAYSIASSSMAPSLRYTGRKECDPLGQMTEPETIIVNGTGSNGSIRWGDYFQLNTDPSDGETFWFTGVYSPGSQWQTRIAAFDIGTCGALVAFGASTYGVNEADANVDNGCLDYIDLTVPISITEAPTQNADVTVNVTGGTATQGVDYDILNISHTLNGGNLSGDVTIRVYNDDIVEGDETITLDYTLNANGGDALPGTNNQTVTITINDDDFAPGNMPSGVDITLLSQDFESGWQGFVSTNNAGGAGNDPWQIGDVATASSTAYAIPAHGGNFAWLNDDACDCDQNDVDLDFPIVDLTGYIQANLTFDSYFEDNTYQNINEDCEVFVSVNAGPWTSLGQLTASAIDVAWTTQNFDLTPYVGNASVQLRIKYSDNTGWLYGCSIDDILVTGQEAVDIQQAVNTGTGHEADLGPNGTVHLYDPTSGDVMMTIVNNTAHDYGCVTVEVDRAGTSAAQFNTANTPDFLHDKSFRITPTSDNASGNIDITMFYKEAEVAGWESATGNSRNNLEMVKVNDNPISAVNPGNAGTMTITDQATTLGSHNSDVTVTATFTNGFSGAGGFGAGIYTPASNNPPTASFTAPNSVCAGTQVSFTDNSTDNPTGWSWDFGDGSGASNQQHPNYTYSSSGNFTVTLIASNGNGSDTYTQNITVNPQPNVVGSGTTSICAGQNTTISASGASSYSWDQSLGVGSSHSVSPAITTTYIVTGTDGNGCQNTDQVTVTVNALPNVVAAGGTTICSGTSTVISASGASTYTWNNSLGAGVSHTVSPNITTTYQVTGTDGNGCENTDQVTVTVNQSPTVTATGATSICEGQSTTISASGANSYAWNNGAGNNATATVSPASTTTYIVTGTATNGCTDQDQVTVTVNPNPVITTGTVTSPSNCGNNDGSIVINGSGTGNLTWTGTSSGSAIGVSLPHTINGLSAGNYDFTFVDGNGCTSVSVNESVNDPNAPSAPTISPSGATTFCQGDNVVLTSSYASGNTWSNTETTQNITVTSSGTYTVTYTDGSGCSSTSNPIAVTVNALPNVVGIGSTAICEDEATTISASGASTYTWDNSLGAGASHTVSPSTSTTYIVTGTDANGCENTDQVTVTVNPSPSVSMDPVDTLCVNSGSPVTLIGSPSGGTFSGSGVSGTTFDPNTAGIGSHTITYDYTDGNGCSASSQVVAVVVECNTGVAENGLEGVELFPNPNDGKFTITGLPIGEAYAIYDEKGRIVKEGIVHNENENIALNVAKGMYYLQSTVNGEEGTLKFLIAK